METPVLDYRSLIAFWPLHSLKRIVIIIVWYVGSTLNLTAKEELNTWHASPRMTCFVGIGWKHLHGCVHPLVPHPCVRGSKFQGTRLSPPAPNE